MWSSPHPLALRVDPDAGRSTLIGSRWVRRVPEGDDWDLCEVVGVYEMSEEAGGQMELCVRPVAFGQPVMTADPESFGQAYRRETEDDDSTAERLTARLRDLEARSA